MSMAASSPACSTVALKMSTRVRASGAYAPRRSGAITRRTLSGEGVQIANCDHAPHHSPDPQDTQQPHSIRDYLGRGSDEPMNDTPDTTTPAEETAPLWTQYAPTTPPPPGTSVLPPPAPASTARTSGKGL